MKNLIIVGAGGFGKEIYSYIIDNINNNVIQEYVFKGFVDDDEQNFISLNFPQERWLGTIDDYQYIADDYVIIAIGNIKSRNIIIKKLAKRKVNFYTFIHHSVFIGPNTKIGKGTIICPNSIVQTNANISDHCVLNIYCSIGHDSHLGEGSVLSPYCTLNGNVKTGADLFMGTRSTLLLQTMIGKNCIISAHTVVRGTVGDNMMIKDKVNQIEVKNRLI